MFNDPTYRDLDRISLLESRDLVFRAFKSLHQRKLGANKATEILSHLSQGSSYNKAAEAADEIVRPLLQYYSVAALSRATILLLSPNLRETSLPSKHGLNAVGWKQHLNSGGSWLEARIRVTEGTFSLFGEVTSNKNVIEIYNRPTNEYLAIEVLGSSKYPQDFEFSVGDLLRRIPDLTKLYEAIVDNPASNWMCFIDDRNNSWEMRITSNRLGMPKKDVVAELLNIYNKSQIEEISTNYFGSGSTPELKAVLNTSDSESIKPHLTNLMNANRHAYLVEPFDNDVRLSYPSLILACSYALGMLVRYYPTYWMSMLQHDKGDELWPLLRAAAAATMSFSSSITAYL